MNRDGLLEMPLPFKQRPYLPDNELLDIVRLQHLKWKLVNDKDYREHYVKFTEEVIGNGNAERVYDEGKEGENGTSLTTPRSQGIFK